MILQAGYSTGHVAASFTSTTLDPETHHQAGQFSPLFLTHLSRRGWFSGAVMILRSALRMNSENYQLGKKGQLLV